MQTIIIPWWQFLIHVIIAVAATFMLTVLLLFVIVLIDELNGGTKRRREELKEFELRFFRNYLFNISKVYDDVFKIEYGSENSAFTWFYNKYSDEELMAMDSKKKYELKELFTEEEIYKALHYRERDSTR